MNFLAHLHLSGNNDGIKIGNFIADAVKGKDHMNFEPEIQKGIIIHRAIDHFTDEHEIVGKSKKLLRADYGKHAGIVIDIFYDHFLSIDWNLYSNDNRSEFIKTAYILMINNYLVLPAKVKRYLPFMVVNNWIEKYEKAAGIERVLTGMSTRTSLPAKTARGMELFHMHFDAFRNHFNEFYPELINHVAEISDKY